MGPTNPELLHTFAEVAVGLAGFVTLAAIIGQRTSEPVVIIRVTALLIASVFVILFSLLPGVVASFTWSHSYGWRLCSMLLSVCLAIYWAATVKRIFQDTGFQKLAFVNKLNTSVGYPLCILFSFGIALGYFESNAESIYALILFVLLVFACVVFIQNVFYLLRSDDP